MTNTVGLVVVVFASGLALGACLLAQVTGGEYRAPIDWLTVVMVGIFGTMTADGVHVQLGVPYIASTAFFAVALAVLFIAWNRSEGTLSIHSIHTRRRELFDWAAVLVTFALRNGRRRHDGVQPASRVLRLGAAVRGIVRHPRHRIPLLFGLNGVLAFWFAYIVTSTLGGLVRRPCSPRTVRSAVSGSGTER